MLTVGYIGNGKSTNRYHLPFSLGKDNIRVKTIYTHSLEKKVWPRVDNIVYTDNIDDIMKDKEINLIAVCTPPNSHYEYTMMALSHNKNVLVEKPFTHTSDEAREIFDYAQEKGLFVQCYQNRRYDSDFLTVQKVIESGKLGKVYEVEMNYDYYRPDVSLNATIGSDYEGFIYGHGCHTVDQAVSYFGMPEKVHYDVRYLLEKSRMNDYFDLDFHYPYLKVSIRSSYFRVKARPSFAVYGTKGVFVKQTKDRQEEHLKLFYMPEHSDFGIDLPEHYGVITYIDADGAYHEEKVISEKGDYSRVYQDCYQTIINGKAKVVKDEETLKQLVILAKGIEQCRKC